MCQRGNNVQWNLFKRLNLFLFYVLHRTGQSSTQSASLPVNHLPVRPMQAGSFTAWVNVKIRDAFKCHWVEADMLTGAWWASSISVHKHLWDSHPEMCCFKKISSSQRREWQKPHRLNVSNPRATFMGAFVEVQPGIAKQPANILPLDSLHSTNSLEISLNYSCV